MSGLDGMTIWIPDYFAGTQHFTTTQHGAFFLLLMAMWKADGWLPNDETRLARTAKLTLDKWRTISADILELLLTEGDRITSPRLLRELAKTRNRIDARRYAGRERQKPKDSSIGGCQNPNGGDHQDSGIDPKSLTDNGSGSANADDVQQQNASTTPGTLDSDLGQEKKDKKDSRRVADATPTNVDDLFNRFWASFPKRKGGNPEKPAREIFVRKLRDGADAELIITGAKSFAEQMATDNQIGTRYVPMAKAWLHQERWEEYTESVKAEEKTKTLIFVHRSDTPEQFLEWYLDYLCKEDRFNLLGMENAAQYLGRRPVPTEWPPGHDAGATGFPLRFTRTGADPRQRAWSEFTSRMKANYLRELLFDREVKLPMDWPPTQTETQAAA